MWFLNRPGLLLMKTGISQLMISGLLKYRSTKSQTEIKIQVITSQFLL